MCMPSALCTTIQINHSPSNCRADQGFFLSKTGETRLAADNRPSGAYKILLLFPNCRWGCILVPIRGWGRGRSNWERGRGGGGCRARNNFCSDDFWKRRFRQYVCMYVCVLETFFSRLSQNILCKLGFVNVKTEAGSTVQL